MANARSANSFYVDAASSAGTAASFIELKQTRVASITFTAANAGDSIVLSDLAAAGGAAGTTKLTIKAGAANDTRFINFYDYPLVFPNGLWVTSISAGASATIVTATAGS